MGCASLRFEMRSPPLSAARALSVIEVVAMSAGVCDLSEVGVVERNHTDSTMLV